MPDFRLRLWFVEFSWNVRLIRRLPPSIIDPKQVSIKYPLLCQRPTGYHGVRVVPLEILGRAVPEGGLHPRLRA